MDGTWPVRGKVAISGNSRSDKTFIGRIEKGFDFLGYHFGTDGLSVVKKTIEQFGARGAFPPECRNRHWFLDIEDARAKIEPGRRDGKASTSTWRHREPGAHGLGEIGDESDLSGPKWPGYPVADRRRCIMRYSVRHVGGSALVAVILLVTVFLLVLFFLVSRGG